MILDTPIPTLADLHRRYGAMPASRLRLDRYPADESDVIELHDQDNRLYELKDGVLLEKTMGYREGFLAGWILTILNNYVIPRKLGVVNGADGMMRLAPGLVRIPDVSFVSWSQFPGRKVPSTPVPDLFPELAVEVLSLGNTDKEMTEKLEDYFENGTTLVWLVDPFEKTVTVYTSTNQFTLLTAKDTLDGGSVLPGFAVPVAEIFQAI